MNTHADRREHTEIVQEKTEEKQGAVAKGFTCGANASFLGNGPSVAVLFAFLVEALDLNVDKRLVGECLYCRWLAVLELLDTSVAFDRLCALV